MLRRAVRQFVNANRSISRWQRGMAQRLVGRRNGGRDFRESVLPAMVKDGQRILDVGGGKRPAISPEIKRQKNLYIVGLDIDARELQMAPENAYDDTVVDDVAQAAIPGTFDLIISNAVLEHTRQNRQVIANLASSLKEGGMMAHFIPCRNAVFARLNLLLGNRLARKILFVVQPNKKITSGFKAYYDLCTPSQMSRVCIENGLQVERLTPYYSSDYCSFFAPLYTLDLLRQLLMRALRLRNFTESFVIVATKQAKPDGVSQRLGSGEPALHSPGNAPI